MKRAWIWIIAGLIAFVGAYSFAFPQSQMPVRISLSRLEGTFVPEKGSVYCDNDGLISSAGKILPLPINKFELPEGLEWSDPKVTGFEERGDQTIVSLNGKAFLWDGAMWLSSDAVPPPYDGMGMKGFEAYSFAGIKDGNVILANIDGETKEFFAGDDLNAFDHLPLVSENGALGIEIGGFSYFPTEPTDGRIVKMINGEVVARLDRSRLGCQSIPTAVATDGKRVFALVGSIGDLAYAPVPVQVYNKNLKFEHEFGNARQGRTATGIGIHESFVLLLWDDGLLEGYSLDGYLMFSHKIAHDGTGLMVARHDVYVKGKTWLGICRITVVKPETSIWPRVLDVGAINSLTTKTVTVKSAEEPVLQVKGENVSIIGVSKLGDSWRIQLLLEPAGLAAFEKHNSELIVDMDNLHEIVPISFIPFGSVQRLHLFDDFAIDQKSGLKLTIKELEALEGKKYTNQLTREMIIASPEPGGLVPQR